MSNTSTKKKFSFGKLLIWAIVIFVALHIFTDGESTDSLMELFHPDEPGYTITDPTYDKKPQNTLPQQSVSTPSVSVPPATTLPAAPQPDRLPSVPEELRDHVYLAYRGKGYCEKLTGKVVVTVIFVSDPEGTWSETEINESKTELQSIADRISADAANYGAQVSISFSYKTVSISERIVNNVTDAWMASALSAAGLPALRESNPKLESLYGVDAAPVCFFANHGGRAFASGSYGSEYSIIYDNTHAFYHELNHIFGAKDFYYPKEVKEFSKTYLPDSIMVSSSSGVMDDLTAYLIGWTDTLSDNALSFLKSTAYLTAEYLEEEHKKETYTGYVTDYTYGGGSYTGYLVNGVHHGKGKWIREDGTVWEGTFHHGSFTGTGNYIYESGAVYNGQWVNSKLHGKGTMTWADGNKYTGDFVEGKRTGQGTWTGATGNTYTGGFLNGNFHGQGTYKWADGGSYTGGYENGKRTGQGTMVYQDGAVYKGQWLNGNRHGQGTYTDTNGSTYVGQWADNVRSGQGTLSYANGNSYVGSWSNNTWNGQGTFTWTSGDKYIGAFVDGKRHGYGIYYYPSGNRYEGNWANGERHGQGTMYYANGTSKTGTWDNGKYVG